MTKYCTECGAQNTDDANFCNKCAHPFHQIKQTEIEETPKGIIVGYRNLNGGNGAGLLQEFDFLNNEETKKVIE